MFKKEWGSVGNSNNGTSHPNCRCQLIECIVWEWRTIWEQVKEFDAEYEYIHAVVAVFGGTAYWRKYYTAEEKRTKRRGWDCEDSETELLSVDRPSWPCFWEMILGLMGWGDCLLSY